MICMPKKDGEIGPRLGVGEKVPGTKETAASSTQTVPKSLLSNFQLGTRRRTTASKRVSGLVIKSVSTSDQG